MSDVTLRPRAYAKSILHALKYPHRPVFGVLLAQGDGFHNDNLGQIPDASESSRDSSSERTRNSAGSEMLESKKLVVEDAWALFHSPPACVPMLELAMMQVDELCQQQKLRMVGLYAAGATEPSSSSADGPDDPVLTGRSSSGNSLLESGGGGNSRALTPVSRMVIPQELLRLAPPGAVLLLLKSEGLQQALQPEKDSADPALPIFEVYSARGTTSWQKVGPGVGFPRGQRTKEGTSGGKWDEIESESEGSSGKWGEVPVTSLGLALELVQQYGKEPWRLLQELADFEDHLDDVSLDWQNQDILE